MMDNGECATCGLEPQEAGSAYCDACTEKRVDDYHAGYKAHRDGKSRPVAEVEAVGWDDRAHDVKVQAVIPRSARCSEIDNHPFSGAIGAGKF